MKAADLLDRERVHMTRVPLHQPLEPIAEADDVAATQNTPDRGRPDYAVNAGSRTPSNENSNRRLRRRHPSLLHLCPTSFRLLLELRHGCIFHFIQRQAMHFERTVQAMGGQPGSTRMIQTFERWSHAT